MTTIPTPKQIYEAAIPNPWIDGKYYPVPGMLGLEAKTTHGRGRNAGKTYITIRKPCKVNVVHYETGEIESTYDDYNIARAKMPDGDWKWV